MNDMNELKKSLNKSLNDGRVWIGLQKTGRDEWHWSAGEPVLYLDWATGQPDGRDYCAMMTNGKFYDLPCNDNRHFICNNSKCSYLKSQQPSQVTYVTLVPRGNETLRRNARGTLSALSSSESYV